MTPFEKLELLGRFGELVEILSDDSTSPFDRIEFLAEFGDLIELLGGKIAVTADDVDLSDPEAIEQWATSFFNENPHEKTIENAHAISRLFSGKVPPRLVDVMTSGTAGIFSHVGTLTGASGELAKQVKNRISDKGKERLSSLGISEESLSASFDEVKAIRERMNESISEFDNLRKAQLSAAVELVNEVTRKLNAMANTSRFDDDKDYKFQDEYMELQESRRVLYDDYERIRTEYHADRGEVSKDFKGEIDRIGGKYLSAIIESSPISKEQADSWAASVDIEPKAIARLKRLEKSEYNSEEQLRADISEFYRLCGGKVKDVSIITTGSKRAHASNIFNSGKGEVNIDTDFDKRTLFHELAHFLEFDPTASIAANGFLADRRESDKVYSLKSITGNKTYDSREVAYKDSFIDPYVGKHYRDGASEVFSMGFQEFSNPSRLLYAIQKDPEMINVMIGYMSESHSKLSDMVIKQSSAKKLDIKNMAASLDDAINRLGKLAKGKIALQEGFYKPSRANYFDAKDADRVMKNLSTKKGMDFIGAYPMPSSPKNQIHIFSGLVSGFRAGDGKKKKGYYLVMASDVDSLFAELKDWHSYSKAKFHGNDTMLYAVLGMIEANFSQWGTPSMVIEQSISGIQGMGDRVAFIEDTIKKIQEGEITL